MTATPQDQRPGERHISPIRWPRFSGPTAVLLTGWVLGALVGTVIPALIVPPAGDAATGKVLTAFAVTAVGVAVMVLMGVGLYRRHREGGLIVFTLVPSSAILGGGFILMGQKLFT